MISPLTQTHSTANSAAAPNPSQQVTQTFIQLLLTQLKNQDPTAPMDPTQFVNQLVQFNSLSELIQIRELLSHSAASAAAKSLSPTGGV